MTPVLEVEAISVRFGGVDALRDVSFRVAPGELLGLIGPNGAGKTTMMRAITGVVRPQRGRVRLDGRDLTGLATVRRIQLGLGLSQQLVRPFRRMTVLDNVAFAAGQARMRNPLAALLARDSDAEQARARELLSLLGVEATEQSMPSELPLGMLKRVEMARALALKPKLLLLDEPLAGLNHAEAARLADVIKALHSGGASIILIEHNLAEVMRICDRLVVLDNGRKLADGAPQEVMARPEVRAAYLGGEASDAEASDAEASDAEA